MRELALYGDSARYAEVSSILKMYGGICDIECSDSAMIYYIGSDNMVEYIPVVSIPSGRFMVYKLDDYLSLYPFKVGDAVSFLKNGKCYYSVIKRIVWFKNSCSAYYIMENSHGCEVNELRFYSTGSVSSSSLKLYKVTISAYHFGNVLYNIFVLAHDIASMERIVRQRISRDDSAELVSFEEIDLFDGMERCL